MPHPSLSSSTLNAPVVLRKFEDPGHGWLQVPHDLVHALGIAKDISAYSYRDHQFAYLEEDCDMGRFLHGIFVHRVHLLERSNTMDRAEDGSWKLWSLGRPLTATTADDPERMFRLGSGQWTADRHTGTVAWSIPPEGASGYLKIVSSHVDGESPIRGIRGYRQWSGL